MKYILLFCLTWTFAFSTSFSTFGQEHEIALWENKALTNYIRPQAEGLQRTELSLPFFEDFTGTDYYPDINKWQDSMVYINNTMGLRIKSLGIATFDALDAKGKPYSPQNPYLSVYADSLTSQYFNLSTNNVSDSLYLSFLFEGKGMGYTPASGDSLMLFFQRRNGAWQKVWSVEGQAMEQFYMAMVPINDTVFLHQDFRFRFINKATFNVGNSHWHVDYIKLDANRTHQDSTMSDVAFSYWGNDNLNRSLLREYTSMPYKHFDASRANHFSGVLGLSLWNSWLSTKEVNVGMSLQNSQGGSSFLTPVQQMYIQYNDANTATFNLASNLPIFNATLDEPFHIDMKVYITQPIAGDFSQSNDTIQHRQVFDNYFSYDDGTAEGAFFMSSYQGAPSYVAQEYGLSVPDTIRGVQIYFPRQVPDASHKMFYLQIYKRIDAIGGQTEMVYQQEDCFPIYSEQVNGLVTYKFDNPVVMDAGAFYVAMMFPAGGTSDSLYIGLDKNKVGANFRYYKVGTYWEPSLIDGALMIRPLVGKALPLNINNAENAKNKLDIEIYPNPVKDILQLKIPEASRYTYSIVDALGRTMQSGKVNHPSLDVSKLTEGWYYLQLKNAHNQIINKKILKLK